MKSLGYILVLLLLFSGCDKDPNELILGEEITVKFNESVVLYDGDQLIEIRFTKLVNESRCPPGGICVRAGEAIIEIQVNSNETFELVTCFTKPNCSESYLANCMGYEIELFGVSYGADRNYNNESKYSIDIMVSK